MNYPNLFPAFFNPNGVITLEYLHVEDAVRIANNLITMTHNSDFWQYTSERAFLRA